MITVNTLEEALAVPGAVMIEASTPVKVYFAGDALPAHCAVKEPTAAQQASAEIDRSSGMSRRERDVAIASLPQGHYWRTKAEEAEAAIAALGVRKS